jgi:hypothetical protein
MGFNFMSLIAVVIVAGDSNNHEVLSVLNEPTPSALLDSFV